MSAGVVTDGARVVAVDFGATSIRVVVVDLGAERPEARVVHRAPNVAGRDADGHLRWDWEHLLDELDRGLALAVVEEGPIVSIGVDTWGVDYGLLDGQGRLVAPPFSYRDARTDGWRDVVERVGGEQALHERTGLQLQAFNTVFQLAAHAEQHPDELARAEHLLLLPELVVHHLTGAIVAERTSAATTALVDLDTGTWSAELLDAAGVDAALFPEIRPATTSAGSWRGIPVHLVGGHDTASAVAAGGAEGADFLATGTWLLAGREQATPDRSAAARRQNLSNEAGVLGGVRLLTNVAGFWLLEGCRGAWGDRDVAELTAEAAALGPAEVRGVAPFDAADERFLAPADMLSEVTDALGLERGASPALVTWGIVESMAATATRVFDALPPRRPAPAGAASLAVFGGGVRVPLLLDRLAEHGSREVLAGPVEAAALGNALVQGVALGRFADLAEARRWAAGTGSEAGAGSARVRAGASPR